jgi:two-component system CheB/CheR fusion protein
MRSAARVLVVDDNKDEAVSLGLMLRMMGYAIELAHDGVEALEKAAAFRPDAVLLDIGLPRLNGYAVASQLRRQPQGERRLLIAMTGWGQEEDRRRSSAAGFDHHLVKPADPAVLAELLATLR